jgi:hypothetical protein
MEAIKRSGAIMCDSQVNALKELNEQIEEHGRTWERLKKQVSIAAGESTLAFMKMAVLDRDAKFPKEVADLLVSSGIKPKRTSFRSAWRNGIAERWIDSCRQELVDHVIVLNEAHLHRLMRDYLSYYHEDRIHDSLEKDSASTRPVSHKPYPLANLISFPRVGGLHHRYDWRQAA